ncbi:MAG: hypothetical protein ABI583_00510 [Betaproteobacteria bacterium]
MQYFDACNGDADGLIASHQFRLSFPVPAERVTLITSTKRDMSLLEDTNRKTSDPRMGGVSRGGE